MRCRLAATALLALVALGGSGCGGDDSEPDRTRPDRTEPPQETLDAPPPLPRGWRLLINRTEGFSIGLPPGWQETVKGSATQIRSPDHLVAISISADRTNEALEFPLESFATETIAKQADIENLQADQPREFAARYDAVEVTATGRAKASGVALRVRLVLMRRPDIAAFPILIVRNAKVGRGTYTREIDRMLRSFRGRPVEVPALPSVPR